MNAKFYLAAIMFIILGSGMASVETRAQEKAIAPPSAEIKPVEPSPLIGDDTADNLLTPKRQNEKYRIGFQDTVEISVFRHPGTFAGSERQSRRNDFNAAH